MKNLRSWCAILLLLYTTGAYSQSNVTYVPISIGDITIIIPIFNPDSDGDGVDDYEDPSIQPVEMLDAFSSALTVNNVDMAMKFLLTEKAGQYQAAFEELGASAGEVLQELTNVTIVYESDRIVELAANRTIDGVQRVFFITLMKNENNVWKIVQI